jgi:phenylacetate-CoA ligase
MGRHELHRDFFDMLMESQYWSPEQIRAYQRNELEQLLRHARENVPFYEQRLGCVFARDGSIDWDRWHEVPLVTRKNLQDDRESMQSRRLPPGHGPTTAVSSSGSTGRPVTTTQVNLMALGSRAAHLRALTWQGVDFSMPLLNWIGDDPDHAAWPIGQQMTSWAPAWIGGTGYYHALNRTTPPPQVIEYMARKGIRYLASGTTRAELLALEAERIGSGVALDAVFTRGEAVLQSTRDAVTRAFGARVVSLYSSQECHKMAHPCQAGQHYHVNAEIMLIEIVDDLGRPCRPGEPGRVVVTPFLSTAQPLIRYEIGDVAVPGSTCACGRALPVIDSIVGRVIHMWRLPDGRRIMPIVPDTYLEAVGASMWQLAQTGPASAEFRYVARDPNVSSDEGAIVDAVRKLVSSEFKVKVSRVEAFPLTKAGKHLPYVCELTPDQISQRVSA